jgi:fumarate hydratase, class II
MHSPRRDTRTEHDSFGDIEVPADRLWGAQTQRSIEHFNISTERMPEELIVALAWVKAACAKVNQSLGLLPDDKAVAIRAAAEEVMRGAHSQEFPLAVWQTGSGTQTNMNMNEVLANRASELLGGERGWRRLVHANDEVNLGQSSNDIFPTAIHLAAVLGIENRLFPALAELSTTLAIRSIVFANIIKIGRTHLQDATPLTLGQEFSGYVSQLEHAGTVIKSVLPSLYSLAVGATAVGTGLNTHPEFGARVAAELAASTDCAFVDARNHFAAIASHDDLVAIHGTLKMLAVALMKIVNDIRWLASGPRCGLGEITIPENEPGSSMMPGKTNPTQCEALTMICCQVMGNDVAIGIGGASGSFELNVYKPLLAHNLLQSVRILTDGMISLDHHCIRGIEAREGHIAQLMSRSLMLATVLVPHIGYEKTAEIASKAHRDDSTLKEAALAFGYVSAEDFDNWVQPPAMVGMHTSHHD